MDRTFRAWLLSGLTLAAGTLASGVLVGCDRSCDAYATCVPDGWTGGGEGEDGCPVDPADGPVGPECGIWVSTSQGLDSSPGTQEEPVQTLAKAIELAQSGRGRVYACGEVYQEAVSIPSGVSLFGGFDCANEWGYSGMSHRAKIVSAPDLIALTMLEGDKPSLVGDIEAHSADAVKPGGSSMAVLVLDQAKGALLRSDIFAGNGADGADGEDGGLEVDPKDGLSGQDGADACTTEPGLGGASIKLDCGDGTFSMGGPGGDGGELVAGGGGAGLPLPEPNLEDYGLGGKGEELAPMCTGGQGGVQGAPGQDGARAVIARQRLTQQGAVLGGDGGDGTPGLPGQGGGGGGASFGKAIVCGGAPPGGAGGGSGGTGGCGGRGGKGGQAGGASIGLAVRGEGVELRDLRITAGNGGRGGRGGQSQPGGQGGLAGIGGQGVGAGGGIQSGCPGGSGGNGGNGGYGSGGRGGDSVAVAEVGLGNVNLLGDSQKLFGAPGPGGDGGNPAIFALAGYWGTAAGNLTFDP